MKNIIKIAVVVALVLGAVGFIGLFLRSNSADEAELRIISTSFPGYDFARAVTKDVDATEAKMLLKPGAESHDFEPTPQDIKDIQNSDVFIYVGGDSDEWIEDILSSIDTGKTKIIKMMDLVETVEESAVEGMEDVDEEGAEEDEHVWTSPVNAIKIIRELKDEIVKIDAKDTASYEKNAEKYIEELTEIDAKIRDVVQNAKRHELIFGDRFPLRYFTDEYGLSYYAAFPGCSEQTEASAKTISFLIDKVREDKAPVVFHIELSSGKIADAIAKETGAKVLEFNSAHNISQKDFEAGVTYADIMRKNLEVLSEALD